jgi:hypothetical protein
MSRVKEDQRGAPPQRSAFRNLLPACSGTKYQSEPASKQRLQTWVSDSREPYVRSLRGCDKALEVHAFNSTDGRLRPDVEDNHDSSHPGTPTAEARSCASWPEPETKLTGGAENLLSSASSSGYPGVAGVGFAMVLPCTSLNDAVHTSHCSSWEFLLINCSSASAPAWFPRTGVKGVHLAPRTRSILSDSPRDAAPRAYEATGLRRQIRFSNYLLRLF